MRPDQMSFRRMGSLPGGPRTGSITTEGAATAIAAHPASGSWRLLLSFAALTLLVLGAAFAVTPAAHAQQKSLLLQGDTIVTGFSGVKKPDTPPPGDPLDETFIDPDGASAQIRTFGALAAPPSGQVVDAPAILKISAKDVGQVFAIALDAGTGAGLTQTAPDIYLGATSAFGLQIVIPDSDGDGRPERVKTGQPNAQWMAGQFGLDKGGGPGSIWKVDGVTGTASRFATIPANSGPGIGDIVFDKATRQFFVSDLDTGLIHRLDGAGTLIDSFDHGQTGRAAGGLAAIADDGKVADIESPAFNSEDASTWGFTAPERRVWGLGLRAGRLYYAIVAGPEVWSVSIDLDGTFGRDPRREIEVSGTPNNHPISDIAFDSADFMYVAQRGGTRGSYDYSVFADSKQSVVFRYKREIPDDPATPGIWVPIPDEIAIGLPPDHRNTSGGIALGLAHEPAGAFRYGACDQMIWATGDSLRDSPVQAPELTAGGPSIVHGLQGSDRALVRPDNEPPLKSYFVDYDGRFDDPQKQGHVGDVEIWQPCDRAADFGSYTPLPYLPPGYLPPAYTPPGGGTPTYGYNLRLDKEAVPGACALGGLGVLCDYVVRVTNTGPAPYIGPIVVNDRLPATPAGAVMTFANQPPWLCLEILPSEHQCTYDPAVLWPGDSIDLYVTVDLPVAPPVCHLDNVAALVWPLGFGDANPADDIDLATATIPAAHCPPPAGEKTNLKIEKFPWVPVCSDTPAAFECQFLVIVRNMGPGNYTGTIKVDEILPAGTTATFSLQPPWTCAGAGPAYACEHEPVVLNPFQGVALGVVATVPKDLADDLGCKVTNKVKIVHALGGSDQNTDPLDDEAEATALLPALCPVLPILNNLKIEKTGLADKCPVAGANWECRFVLKVTNGLGPAYTSEIRVLDALPFGMPAGTTISFAPPAEWQCAGPVLFPNLYGCSSANPNLAPGATVEIPATVKVPVGPVAQCSIKNNAQIITAPPGSLLNVFNNDDLASATAQFAPVFPLGGDPAICLSPAMGKPEPPLVSPKKEDTNLTITKTAGPSTKTPTGQNTLFTIKVTNAGEGVHSGPLEVLDTLFDGSPVEPSNGSWSGLWVCEGQSAAGHPEQGLCTHPAIELDPGESVTLDLEIEAPNSYVAPSGSQVKCGYKNKVEILEPAGGSPQNTNAGDDTAFAEAHFEPFEMHGTKFCELGLTTPPPPSCPQGWSRTPVPGKCCPPRTGWDGKRCKRGETPPEEKCPANSVGDYPDCRCKPGYTGTPPNCRKRDEPESCKKTALCTAGRVWNKEDCACVCPPGKPWNPALWRCGSVIVDPPPCTDGKVRIDGVCQCPQGTRWDDGKCRTPPVTTPCTDGKVRIDGVCQCPQGTRWDDGKCRTSPVTTPCTDGKVRIDGVCQCPQGTRWDDGKCRTPPVTTCPANTVGRFPNCRCKPGFKGTPPNCTPVIVDPPRPTCPANSVGKFPNCRCRPGYKGTPPNCTRVVVTPPVITLKCPANSVGRFPNCRCKPGFKGRPPNCKSVKAPASPPTISVPKKTSVKPLLKIPAPRRLSNAPSKTIR